MDLWICLTMICWCSLFCYGLFRHNCDHEVLKGPLFDRNNVPSPLFQTCCHGGGRNSSRKSLNLVVGCWYHTIHTHAGVLEQAMASSFRDHSRSTWCSRIECQTKHVRNGLLLQSPQDDSVVRIDCVTLLDSHSAYQVAYPNTKAGGHASRSWPNCGNFGSSIDAAHGANSWHDQFWKLTKHMFQRRKPSNMWLSWMISNQQLKLFRSLYKQGA